MPTHRTPRLRSGATLSLLALLVAVPLQAHDFWLVPLGFMTAVGAEVTILGQTSSAFPSTLSAVTVDRIASATLVGANESTRLTQLDVAGTSLRLRTRPATAGQQVVAVTIHPRSVRESSEAFQRYLVLEGAPEALERLKAEGRVPKDSVTRRYAKYAKSLVTIGSEGPSAWSRTVGHPLEFVPEGSLTLAQGHTVPVKLILLGKPAVHAKVHAGFVPLTDAAGLNAQGGKEQAVELETDGDGIVRVPLSAPGLWNLRTIQIVEAPRGSGADWDTHWATLVFAVEGAHHPGLSGKQW